MSPALHVTAGPRACARASQACNRAKLCVLQSAVALLPLLSSQHTGQVDGWQLT